MSLSFGYFYKLSFRAYGAILVSSGRSVHSGPCTSIFRR
nr:MAG TPA: hypothetical protein [Caudoviricetes sp.]